MDTIKPGDKITNPHTGKVNTVWKLEHIHLNIMRVRLRTGVSLDYRPGTIITLPNGTQASVGRYA